MAHFTAYLGILQDAQRVKYGNHETKQLFSKPVSPKNSLSIRLKKDMKADTLFVFCLSYFFHKNNWQASIFFDQLQFTNSSCELTLFLDWCCFYKHPHNIEGTLHVSLSYCPIVTAGVTDESCCGFQLFPCEQNLIQNLAVK